MRYKIICLSLVYFFRTHSIGEKRTEHLRHNGQYKITEAASIVIGVDGQTNHEKAGLEKARVQHFTRLSAVLDYRIEMVYPEVACGRVDLSDITEKFVGVDLKQRQINTP